MENFESTKVGGIECNVNSKISVPWSSETNWIAAHGSLEASVTVESSDYPVVESDLDFTSRRSPLVLKPPLPDSGPCEIKICFDQKYEVGQIYVRSTARMYEVYYARSPHSSSQYLCTVRCCVAERDDELLQVTCMEDVGENITEEAAADRGGIVSSEDDWVKIKVPEVGKSFLPDKINTNRVENVQDLYEATAQISDSDPCSVLTIRLVSLQEKGNVYVDEIYVFADPLESTDSENEEMLAGGHSTQSSLLAMFVPTLLQMSKSPVHHVQDKHAPGEVIKDNKMGSETKGRNETDVRLEINQVNGHYIEKKDTQSVEPVDIKGSPPGHLENALEQLISRVSRVEDILLRFEEKMTKPIESIDARLQQVEHQVQKLVDNSKYYNSAPHCTRISAPSFSCSESLSSSFQSDLPFCGSLSKLEKKDTNTPKFLSHDASSFQNDLPELEEKDNITPELLSHDSEFHPSLVFRAPEFPEKEDNDDLERQPKKESPKKTVSVDDAIAAALNGFLVTAKVEATSGLSDKVVEENQCQERESCETNAKEFRAPEFTIEEVSSEEGLNYTGTSEIKKDEQDHGDVLVTGSSQSESQPSSAFEVNTIDNYFESGNDFGSENDVNGKTEPGRTISFNNDDDEDDMASKQVLTRFSKSVSSCNSVLDYEFPILEVKFASGVNAPLEALLDGTLESNADVESGGNPATDLLLESSSAPTVPEMNPSLD